MATPSSPAPPGRKPAWRECAWYLSLSGCIGTHAACKPLPADSTKNHAVKKRPGLGGADLPESINPLQPPKPLRPTSSVLTCSKAYGSDFITERIVG